MLKNYPVRVLVRLILLAVVLPLSLVANNLLAQGQFAKEVRTDTIDRVPSQRDGLVGTAATLEIVSIAPSTDSITRIEASGIWPTSCVPTLESVEALDGGYMLITAVADRVGAPCGQAETAWTFAIAHHFDEPNYYTIELRIDSESTGTTAGLATANVIVAGGLSVSPQNPNADEPFTISTDGIHRDGCVPENASYEVDGNTIVVDIVTPDLVEIVCGQALTPWQRDVEIVGLAVSDYVVEVYVADLYDDVVENRMLHQTTELSIGVATAQSTSFSIFLPGFIRD